MLGNKPAGVKTPHTFQRGEVYWVSFDPSVGSEIEKRRPGVIVSNDTANPYLDRVQVVPITSNVERVYPSDALVIVGGRKSKAMAGEIATALCERLGDRLGHLTAENMRDIDRAIKIQLNLSDV